MKFKDFKYGVLEQSFKDRGLENIKIGQKVKTPFSTTLFLWLVWIFYAKWVYMYRTLKDRKNKTMIERVRKED